MSNKKKKASNGVKRAGRTVQQIAKVADKIGDVAAVIPGGKAVSAGIKAGAMVGKGAGKLMSLNHPEWYTKGIISNSGLNFNHEMGDTTDNHAIVAGANNLTVVLAPGGIVNKTPEPVDDNAVTVSYDTLTFRTQIALMYKRIRASNSGRPAYEPKDVARYLIYVRLYHAHLLDLISEYKVFNNIRRIDKRPPLAFQRAFGLSDADIDYALQNRGDILNDLNYEIILWNESVRMLPNMTIFDRSSWLFSKVFLDSDQGKSVPTGVSLTSKQMILNSNYEYETITLGDTYEERIASLKSIRAVIVDDATFCTIQGDMEKIQPNNPYQLPIVNFADEIEVLYDEYVNSQIINATSTRSDGLVAFSGSYDTTLDVLQSCYDIGNGANTVPIGIRDITITSSKNDPSIGEQISMTRFSSPMGTVGVVGQPGPGGYSKANVYMAVINDMYVAKVRNYEWVNGSNDLIEYDHVDYVDSDLDIHETAALTQVANMPLVRYYDNVKNEVTVLGNLDVTVEYSLSQAKSFNRIAMKSLLDFGDTAKTGFKDK